ncbi:MAG TPA: RelA/SpoT domain-containing protein [Bacillota bacterium]|nr:RelA/SpoT domain-containing protein [Bacillota bacterium]HOR86145.1 RelA/SpoT domain-containing protein [Bacillota bacterium]HPL53387.1 RelA/SpoT domain-containing protein [Bacillota bacterium]
MSLINEFLQRYAKEYDFYNKLAHQVAVICESIIQRSGIRAIVTYRAKKPDSLREKLIKRNSFKKYQNIEQIYSDIVDLSGVRIAIYFPGDREEIGKLIESEFNTEKIKRFPNTEQKHYQEISFNRQFTGYDAVHYRVKIKENKLEDNNKRFAHAQVEIQIASSLMHAWAEVEHDLAYKPQIGSLSEEELTILDELNGIILAGEIALEKLQKAFKRRIASMEQQFNNHYELAALIRRKINRSLLEDYYMGRVDILLKFLQKIELDNPRKACPYMSSLDNIRTIRGYNTIVDYFADLILNQNPDYYSQYVEAKYESSYNNPYVSIQKQIMLSKENTLLGIFIEKWIVLEKTVKSMVQDNEDKEESKVRIEHREPLASMVKRDITADELMLEDIKHLEGIRNKIIYSTEMPDNQQLENSIQLISFILKRLSEQSEGR